jgi:hypothetical protein
MDKLPEPVYQTDKNWSRLYVGLGELRAKEDSTFYKSFILLAGVTSYKYVREVTFYKRNYLTSLAVLSGFIFSSYNYAQGKAYSNFLLAAEKNNAAELEFIKNYKALYKEAKAKNIDIPDELII